MRHDCIFDMAVLSESTAQAFARACFHPRGRFAGLPAFRWQRSGLSEFGIGEEMG